MKKSLLIILCGLGMFSGASFAHADCPLGPNEDHLTLPRVMMNFGHATMDADALARQGADPLQAKVSDTELAPIPDQLAVAVDCANAVLKSPQGDLLPDPAKNLTGQDLANFVSDYTYFMTDFRDGLIVYQNLFKTLIATPAAQRDYTAVAKECQDLNDMVDHAHRDLGGGSH